MKASPRNCALCNNKAETDSGSGNELYQCSNGACKQAAWGVNYWNDNQKRIEEWFQDSVKLDAIKDIIK